MPITAIFWDGQLGRDIHVLAGKGVAPLIHDRLVFVPASGPPVFAESYQASHSDVKLQFVPIFRPQSTSGDFVIGHGITVNTRTGAVSIAATLPALPKHNFLIEARATNTGSTDVLRLRIRIHVHKSIKPNGVWLSPTQLTVRADAMLPSGATNYRFSVRAEFDDDVVGDLTEGHGVIWGPANVTSEGRIRVPPGAAPGFTFPIRATLPASLGGQFAQQNVVVGTPWAADPNRPVAEPIPGGGFAGGVPIESVPNVVFVSCGHEAADQGDFVKLTTRVVSRLRQFATLTPYNRLTPSMNFWRIFVPPSAARSLSSPGELSLLEIDGVLRGFAQPVLVEPPATGPLDYRHLLYLAGLPVRAQRKMPAETPAQTAAAIAAIRADWATLTEVDLARVTDPAINFWRQYADRAFLEEYDAFPGMSTGEVTSAAVVEPTFLRLHPDRGGRAGLDALFRSVQASSGVTLTGGANVGTLWASSSTSFAFENFRYVFLISPYFSGRASGGEHVSVPSPHRLGEKTTLQFLAPRREVRASGGAPAADVEAYYGSMIAHELAHQFRLGDEYADLPTKSNATVADLATTPNLQAEAGARGAGGKLRGDEIKWNWHRIAKAAPVVGTINIVGTTFVIPVAAGSGSQFAVGEKLFLRARRPRTPLDKTTPVMTTLLTVMAPVQPDVVTVDSAGLGAANLAPYQNGSIIFLPVPVSADDQPGPDPHARLVSNQARGYVDTFDQPFTGPLCADPSAVLGSGVQQPRTIPVPKWLKCNKDLPSMIGLWEGGLRHACDIFHPAGRCKMREGREDLQEFCLVCAYALADLINPVVHADVERNYLKKLKKP